MSKRQGRKQDFHPSNVSAKRSDNLSSHESSDKGSISLYIKDDEMKNVLKKKGILKLFPIQFETFNYIYSGKDIVARDRTGSGKTLAFSLPVITKMREENSTSKERLVKFLIVLPTRELAIQVKNQIQSLQLSTKNDFKVLAIYGGSSIENQISIIKGGIDIIVATPGRLVDLLNRKEINFSQLKVTCLDEADEMLKQGFQEDIEKIFTFIQNDCQKKTQNLLFSATVPEWIWNISEKYQSKDFKYIDLIKDSLIQTSKTVEHYTVEADESEKQNLIHPVIEHFLSDKKDRKLIIFCQTKRQVNKIFQSEAITLRKRALHGDIPQFAREKVFKMFKEGKLECLIATNVAARGLDFPQIDLIIQMEPPKTTDTYIHRSGRTGRAGNKGLCFTFCSDRERYLMKKIKNEAKIYLKTMNVNDLKVKKSSEMERRKNNENGRRQRSVDRSERNERREQPSNNNEDMDY